MEHNDILIAQNFTTDISSLDFETMVLPKAWSELEINPAYSAINQEIIEWLEKNTPTIYSLAVESSKRKPHDLALINAIKAKVLFEQLEYIGLRSMQNNRYRNLFHDVFSNIEKCLNAKFRKHDVKPELITAHKFNPRDINISVDNLFSRYGITEYKSEQLNELLAQQPDSIYLNLVNTVNQEVMILNELSQSILEIEFSPKDQSDYHTCSCCFRWIRLKPSNRDEIAYHGYSLSKGWYNDIVSQSCNGSKYPPFQLSAEGTIAEMTNTRNDITSFKKSYVIAEKNEKKLPQRDHERLLRQIDSQIRMREHYLKFAITKITKKHPDRLEEAKSI